MYVCGKRLTTSMYIFELILNLTDIIMTIVFRNGVNEIS